MKNHRFAILASLLFIAVAPGPALAQSTSPPFREASYERLHLESVAAIDFSPDGKLLATISLDRTVKVHAWAERKTLATLTGYAIGDREGTHDRKVRFVDGGKKLLTASHDGEMQLREWTTDTLVWKTVIGGRSLALSPKEDALITADWESPWLSRWDMRTGKLTGQMRALDVDVAWGGWPQGTVAWSHCGKFFASAGGGTRDDSARNTRVVVWDAATSKPLKEFTIEKRRVHTLQFSPDGRQLVAGTTEGGVQVFSWGSKEGTAADEQRFSQLVRQLDDDRFAVREAAQQALTALGAEVLPKLQIAWQRAEAFEARMRLRDILAAIEFRARDRAALDRLHPGTVLSVAFSPDGRYLASACRVHQQNQGTIVVRDRATERVVLSVPDTGATCVAFSPDNRYLGAAYQDGSVRVWEVAASK